MNTPRKLLFIDRDGTILCEPDDEQIDRLEKVRFVPGVIGALRSIAQTDYVPVMVSNQDGLGTSSFPEADFWPAHRLMTETLAGEGFRFAAEHIDRSFPEDNHPGRKPGTAMLTSYLTGGYDIPHSFVIGDRLTDVQLAARLGARAIFLAPHEEGMRRAAQAGLAEHCALITDSWAEIAEYLRRTERRAEERRHTAETDIHVVVDLDGEGESRIDTGLRFFDHMLAQLPHHAGIALTAECRGDLDVDEHHTMEDTAIVLGNCLRRALGDKRGIDRYGFVLPMDECRAMALIDFGGRAELCWDVKFTREYVGDTPTEMYPHFFRSLCTAMQCNLHISAVGENNHHLVEAVFKAFARALRAAVRRDVFRYELPSSKGVIA